VGFIGHITIGDDVQIAAQSGVGQDLADGTVFAGSPARPHNLWRRIEACITRLPQLFRRVRALESQYKRKDNSSKRQT
jgi:UDP-3-O-[3-hydroxymyristoyl] glucosamine N-acyltransferase